MKVKIRPLVRNDAYVSVKWRNIPYLWEYTKYKPTKKINLEDELNWIDKVLINSREKRFAIMVDATYVGNIYLTNICDKRAEYHIFIGEIGYWGKGIAKAASLQLIEFAKNKLNLLLIDLYVSDKNTVALRLYQSLGFKESERQNDFIHMILNF